ncbi:MAG: PilZ domain-containing protein [Candidatus Omnitrophica bacterium]|nr:PilZ domain-containing protein [Candidatus Omnitrophota bacterium]
MATGLKKGDAEMENDALEERRRHHRFNFSNPMRYKKIETHGKEFKGSLMRDISVGGARMTIFEFLPLNLRLAAEIPLTMGARPVRSTGRVAWISKTAYGDQYEVGIEFTGLDPDDMGQISEFIACQRT